MFVRLLSLVCGAAAALGISAAQEPFRLQNALEFPEGFTVDGEARVRYEALDGQFRAGSSGSDQLLLFRSLIHARYETDNVEIGVEFQDSRTYLGDSGTPLSSSIADPFDVLQAYVGFKNVPGVLGASSDGSLKVGRQTVSIGSKRQIERVDFANVIKSFTGAQFQSTNARGDELYAIYVVPTERFPNTRPKLDDNVLSGNEEQWGRQIWGVHYRRADLLPSVSGLWGELFVYGLEERDTDQVQTPDRSHIAPGFRLYRKPSIGQWDIDLEGALRRGTRYATSAPDEQNALDVEASMLFAALGHTFDTPWRPRFAFEYYYASGDEDPTDDIYGQHERLFGSRRSDLNNTSIHGPLTPANLNAPGFRVEVKPNSRWDGRFYYHAAHLASATDSWVIAKRRDSTGESGDFIGHTLDGRVRYWMVPDSVRLELGASALLYGDFAKDITAAPSGDGTLFGYTQLTVAF